MLPLREVEVKFRNGRHCSGTRLLGGSSVVLNDPVVRHGPFLISTITEVQYFLGDGLPFAREFELFKLFNLG